MKQDPLIEGVTVVTTTYTPPSISDLPSASTRPPGAHISRENRRARWRLARREFLRVTSGAAVGTGIAFVGLFPTARRPAHATHQTPSTLTDGCYGSPFAGSTGCCACGSNVGSSWCGSDGWHKHHPESGSYWSASYRLRTGSCNGKNAWIWERGGNDWRCSDGEKRECWYTGGGTQCGGWVPTVCPKVV
jgi:hypothetical protein